jgi:hypothetical protein
MESKASALGALLKLWTPKKRLKLKYHVGWIKLFFSVSTKMAPKKTGGYAIALSTLQLKLWTPE